MTTGFCRDHQQFTSTCAVHQHAQLVAHTLTHAPTSACTDRGRLRTVLKAALQEMLPDDAHTRIAQRPAAVGVAYTVVNPLPVGTVVTEFTSKEDIIECLLGSCYVPFWFNGSATTRVRGE
eukprot:7092-Heterococcus_DN1.PRE.1